MLFRIISSTLKDIVTQKLIVLPKRIGLSLRLSLRECHTEIDRYYPHRVRMTYQAYCQDEVIEIIDDPDHESITGLIPQLTLWYVRFDT